MAVPAAFLIYNIANMFGSDEPEVETDHINMNLPAPNVDSKYDKLKAMQSRYSKDDNLFSAVDGIGQEKNEKESVDGDNAYTEEEIRKIIDEAEKKQREQQKIIEMQNRMDASTSRYAAARQPSGQSHEEYSSQVNRQIEDIQRQSRERMKALLDEPDPDEQERAEANRLAREQALKAKEEEPSEVIKASALSHSQFNTVGNNSADAADSPLIKAMIDRTTKSTDGTRLRFKLLDDVIVDDVKLLKGSYIYGTVSGFGTQRVKANVTSILVGSRFLKVNLSVYDVDGMEGFYVPASSFREFMQNAAAGVAGASIQFNNNSSSSGINAENLALQALQNIYSAGSSAISRNIKKNKAKIKYNTIVYLVNTKNI